jgi:hypothetical protein
MTNEMETEIAEALAYLKSGGLGEVYGLAEMSAQMGEPKVQMDTSMALALCRLANQGPQGAEFDWSDRMLGNQGQA